MRIGIIIILLLFFGCKTAKNSHVQQQQRDSIVLVTKTKIDTLRIVEVRTVIDSVHNYIEIDCDSTTFQQQFNNSKTDLNISKSKGKVIIRYGQSPILDKSTVANQKSVEVNDSITAVKDQSFDKEVIIKNKIPTWYWYVLIGSNLLWILFRNIIFKFIKII